MSQLVLAHIFTEAQLEQYTKAALLEDDIDSPDDSTEITPFFEYNATPMMCLAVLLEDALEGLEVPESVQKLRELEEPIPVLFAFHFSSRASILAALEHLKTGPDALGVYYEKFYEQSWDEATQAMLSACGFLLDGLERLSSEECWLLVFVA
jgi:hypothetical protein